MIYASAPSKAIIVDLDNTLARNTGRGWYDYSLVHTDAVDPIVHETIKRYQDDHEVIIVTGRSNDCQDETVKWLNDNDIHFDQIYMRKPSDDRPDTIFKLETFDTHIRGKYEVSFALEDRNGVVDMYRANNIKVYQVERAD